ncbi:hypothetical protein [Streptomyces sp. NPDC054962]
MTAAAITHDAGEVLANLHDGPREAKDQAGSARPASPPWRRKLAAMRELTARHFVVHLGMPDLRDLVARVDSDRGNEDAKQRP